ncbi:hypothetical protein HZS_7320 [Henneguya salminicola]|nr:hypothetical protein HZS_7320 [Henneguya salminicola]
MTLPNERIVISWIPAIQTTDFCQVNTEKSTDTLIAKNLPAGTTAKELFEFIQSNLHTDDTYCMPNVILPPYGVTAIIAFGNKNEAKKAFKSLYFSKFKHLPFYLQWAPLNSFNKSVIKQSNEINKPINASNSVVYVKNINFKTSDKSIEEKFKIVGKIVKVTIARSKSKDNNNIINSLGYGFIEFSTQEEARNAVKTMQHTLLDGHRLVLNMSKNTKQEQNKMTFQNSSNTIQQEDEVVIIAKNIPFEADQKEIEQLFRYFLSMINSVYGRLRRVRLPKKMHESQQRHRGFAFIDFFTKEDAFNAFESLRYSTHLYGRRLVLEWANRSNSIELLQKRAASSSLNLETYKRKKSIMQTEDHKIDVE